MQNIFEEQIDWLSTNNANNQTQIKHKIIQPRLQYKKSNEQMVIKDLMGCFLIPGIDRAKLKKQIKQKQQRFKNTANTILKRVVDLDAGLKKDVHNHANQ